MPFYVAQEKGFLKKVGLEGGIHPNEYRHPTPGARQRQYQFFPLAVAGISAAVAGLPLVVVLNFYNITPWMLVTSKDINKPQDLSAKRSPSRLFAPRVIN